MDILGVRVDNFSKKEILEKVSHFLNEDALRRVATVNPEIVLEAQKDETRRKILNSCDLNVADGMGIRLAFLKRGEKLKGRITGVDLMNELLKIADQKGMSVFLATNKEGLSSWEETRDAILDRIPTLRINGTNVNKNEIIDGLEINGDIVFCNFGAPFQEKFLYSLKSDKIKLAVGVGGSFDYLTGKLKRAPKWMQFLGIEWLWRLLLQPKRWKRIFNAVIIFPIKIFFNSPR